MNDVIADAPDSMRNVTEWAKQEACWNRVKQMDVEWPEALKGDLISSEDLTDERRTAVMDQRMLNGIEAQTIVFQTGSDFWSDVKEWGLSKGLLSPDDTGILDVARSVPDRVPSERQSIRAIEVLRRLHEEGCQLGIDVI